MDEAGHSEARRTLIDWLSPNTVPWLAWAIGLGALSLNVMAAAGFNPSGAVRLVTTVGPVQVILGILVVHGGLLVLLGCVFYLVELHRVRNLTLSFAVAIVAVTVSLFAVPAPVAVFASTIVTIALVARSLVARNAWVPSPRSVLWISGFSRVLLGIGLIFAAYTSTWLPAEHIVWTFDRVSGEEASTVGYLIEDSGEWLTLLETTSTPLVIPTEFVLQRWPCVPADSFWSMGRSFVARWIGSRVDECPATVPTELLPSEIP